MIARVYVRDFSSNNVAGEYVIVGGRQVEIGTEPSAYQPRASGPPGTAAARWSEWKPLVVGDATARGFQFRQRLISHQYGITPLVRRLEVTVDMPDRQEGGNDLPVPSTGLHVNFAPPFMKLRGIGITAQGLISGDTWTITNKSESGFDIQFKNAQGAFVARTLDYVATGYGRKVS